MVVAPAGVCTWTTPAANTPAVRIVDKSITLQGADNLATVIVDGTGSAWNETTLRVDSVAGKPFRVTHLTLQEGATIVRIGTAIFGERH